MDQGKTRAAMAALASQVDKGLEFQAVLDTFSLRMWQNGLRQVLLDSPKGSFQLSMGLVHIRAVRKAQDTFLVFIASGGTQCAAVGLLSDDTHTLYHLWSQGTLGDIEDVVDVALQRFPGPRGLETFLSYPDALTWDPK